MGGMTNPRRTHTLIDSAGNVIEDTLKHSLVSTDLDHWLIHKWILPANGVLVFDYENLAAQPDSVGVTIKTLDVGLL